MAAITIKTNLGVVLDRIKEKVEKLRDKEYLLRPVAFDVIDLMTKRIHEDGKDSAGNLIGEYSSEYLILRQEKYQRKNESKVIVSLTRQLENDWAVIATSKGYGIGFNNVLNFNKAGWVEDTYDKVIFQMTESEKEHATTRIQELVQEALQ